MSKVAVVTDSTAYLPEELTKQYNITVIPLSVIWGENVYRDGVDILPGEFYERQAKSKAMPTTSQVTVNAMQDAFKRLLDQDNDVLGIFLSSKFSGTVESALQAREMLIDAKDRIAIVDSLLTTMAMGWSVLTAARAAQAEEALAECRKIAENARNHSGVLFMVDTLEFLRRGGRIGGGQAFLGNVLNIKPILEMHHGQIEPVERVRTKNKAIERVVELATERIEGKNPVRLAVTHSNAEADAALLLDIAKAKLNPIETLISPLSPVIGTHAGPGTIALNYMAGIE